ncbi:hypothetical protein ABZT47_33770 [Sphaerisporangium sp. NPDC005289]|uniref:hypothetical protein n=1 Tax=Sphaerisporangium sp. NPDC005289 TaxID=3155247 RepID=UPI0033BCCF07
MRAGQAQAACSLLAPSTAEDVGSGEGGCAKAILRLGLPAGQGAGTARVWGDEAQVRLADDTVFLHRFAHGWLVRAAGCTPRGERPYQCDVGS